MNKEELGVKLSQVRGGRQITTLSNHVIKSIEEGRSSYSVQNLITYCEELSLQMVITDIALDENYPVDTVADVHDVLQMLMQRWQVSKTSIYHKTGVHYTVSKSNSGTLSVTTFLAMCKALYCKLDFMDISIN